MKFAGHRCFCGKPAYPVPEVPPGPIPGGHPNLSDHGYARCAQHLRENACPACASQRLEPVRRDS
jgi:hypothetical protein